MRPVTNRPVLLIDKRLNLFDQHAAIELSQSGMGRGRRREFMLSGQAAAIDADNNQWLYHVLREEGLGKLIHVSFLSREERGGSVKDHLAVLHVKDRIAACGISFVIGMQVDN